MRIFVPSKEGLSRLMRDECSLLHEVEKNTNASIREEDGALQIEGEGSDEWTAEQVLRALVVAFPPERAFKLTNEEWFLEEIDLEQAMRGSPRAVARQKARIIGAGGRAKNTLEELSGAYISVSGDKVALLGKYDDIRAAKEAVLELLEGKPHGSVYALLEKRKRMERIAALR